MDALTILQCGGWVSFLFWLLHRQFKNRGMDSVRHWTIIVYLFILIVIVLLSMLLSV